MIYALYGLAILTAIYIIYKIAWYTVKIMALSSTLKKLEKKNIQVTWHKQLTSALFGKRGEPTFDVITSTDTYRVTLLSIISTHGRWNIEKTKEHYYAEARHFNKWFYKVHKNTETAEIEFDARRELVIQRAKLELPPRDDSVKQILLIWPKPGAFTYSHAKCEHLGNGSRFEPFEIMHAENFLELVEKE